MALTMTMMDTSVATTEKAQSALEELHRSCFACGAEVRQSGLLSVRASAKFMAMPDTTLLSAKSIDT